MTVRIVITGREVIAKAVTVAGLKMLFHGIEFHSNTKFILKKESIV